MENINLKFSLRAAFCRIMYCVYLDTSPQEVVNPVGYSRLWDNIPSEVVLHDYCPWREKLVHFIFYTHLYIIMIYSAADNSDSESEDESFDSSSHTSLDSIKGLIIHSHN